MNWTMKLLKENPGLTTISTKTKKKMAADPSFKRDSPSIIIFNLILAPVDLRMATTATGSVAARIELKERAIPQLKIGWYPSTYIRVKAIRKIVIITAGKASRII
jgi:hypothetical protein